MHETMPPKLRQRQIARNELRHTLTLIASTRKNIRDMEESQDRASAEITSETDDARIRSLRAHISISDHQIRDAERRIADYESPLASQQQAWAESNPDEDILHRIDSFSAAMEEFKQIEQRTADDLIPVIRYLLDNGRDDDARKFVRKLPHGRVKNALLSLIEGSEDRDLVYFNLNADLWARKRAQWLIQFGDDPNHDELLQALASVQHIAYYTNRLMGGNNG